MAFWSNWFTSTPNHAGTSTVFDAGDPHGATVEGNPVEARFFPALNPSPWDGWPGEWSTPSFNMNSRVNELVDVAWRCLDLNASVLSTMPVYRTRNGDMIDPVTWMTNPDPTIYTSWHEFAKQLFWDYQLGEAFVLPMGVGSDGFPSLFRVIPPWLVNIEMRGGFRSYSLGGMDVTEEILHIRYKSDTAYAHGVGPLESAGARMITAGVLAKYIRDIAAKGGVVIQSLETDMNMDRDDMLDMQQQWIEARLQRPGAPPVLDNGIKLVDHNMMSPKDMTMLEIAQFTEGRIAGLLGVPAPLIDLPGAGSLVYSNITSLFDFHDRSSLRPKAASVMSALSFWALPRGQCVELNRDEYTRPSFNERADAWVKLKTAGIVSADEVRAAERFEGEAPDQPTPAPMVDPMVSLTGGAS